MWSRVLKWLKKNNEQVTDIILDLIIGAAGAALLGYILSKYIDLLFEISMMIGERM